MTSSPLVIRVASWENDQEDLKSIRYAVFVEEQGVPVKLDFDDQDVDALHLLAYSNNKPIGTARLLPTGQIGRMAVLPSYRRRGIGKMLLKRTVELALAQGFQYIHLHAQIRAIDFYLANDFVICGDEFEEAGIPHRTMRYQSNAG